MTKMILLVDDTDNMRNLVRDYLAQTGYHVVTAVNGTQALAAAAEVKPDLLIVDVNLPDMSGYELMRQHRDEADTPAIILINGHEATDRIAGLEAGADDCIATPCSLRELAARARAVLRRSGQAAPRAEAPATGDIVAVGW
jgi:DNA-binding response OmpR family regulator